MKITFFLLVLVVVITSIAGADVNPPAATSLTPAVLIGAGAEQAETILSVVERLNGEVRVDFAALERAVHCICWLRPGQRIKKIRIAVENLSATMEKLSTANKQLTSAVRSVSDEVYSPSVDKDARIRRIEKFIAWRDEVDRKATLTSINLGGVAVKIKGIKKD